MNGRFGATLLFSALCCFIFNFVQANMGDDCGCGFPGNPPCSNGCKSIANQGESSCESCGGELESPCETSGECDSGLVLSNGTCRTCGTPGVEACKDGNLRFCREGATLNPMDGRDDTCYKCGHLNTFACEQTVRWALKAESCSECDGCSCEGKPCYEYNSDIGEVQLFNGCTTTFSWVLKENYPMLDIPIPGQVSCTVSPCALFKPESTYKYCLNNLLVSDHMCVQA